VNVVAGFLAVGTLVLTLINRFLLKRIGAARPSKVAEIRRRYFLAGAIGWGLATLFLIVTAVTSFTTFLKLIRALTIDPDRDYQAHP
jgi:hypothetical protein